MQEVVTSLNISFSDVSGPHKATLTKRKNNFFCGDGPNYSIGKQGQVFSLPKNEIDDILSDYTLEETSIKYSDKGEEITEQYVDTNSLELDRWIVLVRGIHAAPVGTSNTQTDYSGRIYAASELPPYFFKNPFHKALIDNFAPTASMEGAVSIPSKKIIILGTTYSYISKTVPDGRIDQEDVKIEIAFRKGVIKEELSLLPSVQDIGPIPQEILDQISEAGFTAQEVLNNRVLAELAGSGVSDDDAQIRYGYTPSELKQAIELAGFSTVGFPDTQDFLISTGGNLRSCISSFASQIGFYWYFDTKNKRIVFVDSDFEQPINLATDSQTIDYSEGENNLTPTFVNCFFGKTNSTLENQSGSPNDRERKIAFKFHPLDWNSIAYSASSDEIDIKEILAKTFWFLRSGSRTDSDLFNKFVYSYEGIADHWNNKNIFAKHDTKKPIKDVFKSLLPTLKITKNWDAIRVGEGSPSDGVLDSLVRFAELYGNTFITAPMSRRRALTLQFDDAQGVVVGPVIGCKELQYFEPLKPIGELLEHLGYEDIKVSQLAANAGVDAEEDKFYFIFIRDLVATTDDEEAKKDVNAFDNCEKPEGGNGDNNQGGGGEGGIQVGEAATGKLDKEFEWMRPIRISRLNSFYYLTRPDDPQPPDNKSSEMIESITENLKEVFIRATIGTVGQGGDGGQGDNSNGPKYEVADIAVESQIISGSREIKVYSGSPNEVATLKSFIPDPANLLPEKSKQVTYSGFVPFDFDINLDSVSYTIGSDGIKTTISHKTKRYIPPSESLILNGSIAQNINRLPSELPAKRRNYLSI